MLTPTHIKETLSTKIYENTIELFNKTVIENDAAGKL